MTQGIHPGANRATRNLRDGEIMLRDASDPVNYVIAALDEGDISWEQTRPQGRNAINVLDRGNLSHMRPGDEAPVTLTFTLKYVEARKQTGNTVCTVYEAIVHAMCAAAWVSTNNDNGGVYTLDAFFEITAPQGSGEESEQIIFRKLHGDVNFTEGDEYNTLTFDGEAFMSTPEINKISSTTSSTTSTTTTSTTAP